MSQIHYKFKSSKDYDSATFDGHSISVFDLKREILLAKGLKGPDDLALTHAESGEEYYDDATLIPKNTPILVARVPAKPGRGGAQRYLEGSGPVRGGMTRNVFDRPGQSNNIGSGSNSYDTMGSKFYKNTVPPQPEQGPTPPVDTSKLSEEEAMKLVFQQEATHWGKTQEGMATATYRPLGKFQSPTRPPLAGGQKPGSGPSGAPGVPGTHPSPYHNRPAMDQQQRPPPNTYVCYRCGKKGEHWIQFCPTNSDKSFEPIGIKKTTGIPKSFLKTVESDVLQSKKGVMVTQDGNLVVAQTNDSAWKKFHEKSRGALTSEEAYATAPVPDDMRCPICRMLLKSAVQAPCCGTNFCDECIRTYLVSPPKGEDPFKCQHCHKALVPDQLMPNHDLRQRVDLHLRDWAKSRLDPDIAVGMHGRHSRGGTPNLGDERQDTRARQGSPFTPKPSTETTGSAESGTKRRASNDHDAPLNGDQDRDGWKNKKQHTAVASSSNFSRNRPNAGPGGMMDGGAMLPDGMPPGFFEMMQQHDPGLFMDPAFFGPNGVSPFMMTQGFLPPFGPAAGAQNHWGLGRGMPNLPPMGPGFPPPRIGFSDDRNSTQGPGFGAGRGRGRGPWQGNNAPFMERGQDVDNSVLSADGRGGGHDANGRNFQEDGHSRKEDTSRSPRSPPRGPRGAPPGRYDDDDIDMSQVPKGPRGGNDQDDDDIPTGPKAGPDSRQGSCSPPTAPLADRVRNRSISQSRSERESSNIRDSRDSRDSRESRDRYRSRDRDRDRSRDKAGDRDGEREQGHSRDKERQHRRDTSRDRSIERSPQRSRDNDRSRSSRHGRDYDRSTRDRDRDRDRDRNTDRELERESRDQRYESRRDDRRNDKKDDQRYSTASRSDKDRSSSGYSRSDRQDRGSDLHHRRRGRDDRDEDADGDRSSRYSAEDSQSSSRQRSLDPQREYELKRQAAFSISERDGPKKSDDNDQVLFRDRSSRPTPQVTSTSTAAESDRVLFRNQRGSNDDLAVTGLVSNSARERERRDRERSRAYD
ncbi:E3 ubiquitin-protein ligase rbbp6 [Podila minutissima]|uniref:E3 ubiquitin-protein ligase rbbp6 n=1 Tax=Podila minutissima TaxID=64525 RepID=A0A9P5ST34_9FUNG|nr:E3 ubiquitin-protein ligase rbbp6 [Podila minutissima]